MINLFFGPPGNGKSAVAFMLAVDHLKAGGVLATNFKLVEGWASRLAEMRLVCKLGFVDPVTQAHAYWNRCFFACSPQSLTQLSFDFGGKENPLGELVSGRVKRKTKSLPEGRGLAIIDEAQLFLNSRHWEHNFPWIEFFTQHRKLGWDVFLIAHHSDMIDKQVRPLLEYETKLRNLKRVKMPFIPLHFPVSMFSVVSRYTGLPEQSKSSVHSKRLIPLFLPVVRLYDTMEVFAFNSVPQGYSRHGRNPSADSAFDAVPLKISSEQYFESRRLSPVRDRFI